MALLLDLSLIHDLNDEKEIGGYFAVGCRNYCRRSLILFCTVWLWVLAARAIQAQPVAAPDALKRAGEHHVRPHQNRYRHLYLNTPQWTTQR